MEELEQEKDAKLKEAGGGVKEWMSERWKSWSRRRWRNRRRGLRRKRKRLKKKWRRGGRGWG